MTSFTGLWLLQHRGLPFVVSLYSTVPRTLRSSMKSVRCMQNKEGTSSYLQFTWHYSHWIKANAPFYKTSSSH
jgi:hypothetical protein